MTDQEPEPGPKNWAPFMFPDDVPHEFAGVWIEEPADMTEEQWGALSERARSSPTCPGVSVIQTKHDLPHWLARPTEGEDQEC